ncbi:hypothetical protein [Butyrivibrio sp. VCB2001]|uniref:hypothetical protein n=1 Tax=Butyrivibrio sp. VCB2001 TaxID=1280667 RepID=UPI00041F368C|nr:hypothetical protein [Butyrivibrio sp. VCB2001]
MTTRAAMDEQTYMNFYRESVSGYSKKAQRKICKKLITDGKITFDTQTKISFDNNEPKFFEKNDPDIIISSTTMTPDFMGFYEEWEYEKLYKYSVPFFYDSNKSICELLQELGIAKFDEYNYSPDYILRTSIQDATPMWYEKNGKFFVKFVMQKSYFKGDAYEQVDYRYPVLLYFDEALKVIEIRYDALKYTNQQADSDVYPNFVNYCLHWLRDSLKLDIFLCEHENAIDVVNDKSDSSVRMYKQMMDLKSGGAAELKAAKGRDAVLPFVGELRELIDENEELFDKSNEIKELLLKYLNDIEATASYPYIYIKWENAVESQSYIVKITFDYLSQKYTLLQHMTGTCNDLGMERMNNAIKYLCESGSFTKGEQIKY